MIKIAIDGGDYTPGGYVASGIHRLLDSFLREIPDDDKLRCNYYYFGKPEHAKNYYSSIHFKNLPERLFGSVQLPYNVIKDQNDVFLGFSGYLPTLLRLSPIKKIIFLHDLGFFHYPQYYPTAKRLQKQTEFALMHTDKVIVFSHTVRSELVERFKNINGEKIIQIYAGADHFNHYKLIKPQRGNYFLFVGVVKPIKNIDKLLTLFSDYTKKFSDQMTKLVLIGAKEPLYYKHLKNLPTLKSVIKRVTFLERVSDAQLIAYYLGATAVVNMSREEGFCYPVLEALNLDKSAIVNNLPLYSEMKSYFPALTITKTDAQFISAMKHVAENKTTKKSNAHHLFTWKNFAHEVLKYSQSVLGSRASS